jgi:acetyltransferase-like isoleucine patch superfamily enzyme
MRDPDPRAGATEAMVMRWFAQLAWIARQILLRIRWRTLMWLPNETRIRFLREAGVRIGEGCVVYTHLFSTEPDLVEIGDHVAISSGTSFITHDATGHLFEDHPNMDVFGRIKVGDRTYFGTDVIVLPGTTIGSYCVIGSGSVVRGHIPDGSVVMGNPAKVIMKTSLLKHLLVHHKHRLDTRHLSPKEKERVLRRHFGLAPAGSDGKE